MKQQRFLEELRNLLKQYNASISFSVSCNDILLPSRGSCLLTHVNLGQCTESSNTHGLSEERMVVEIGNKEVATVYGWDLNASDLYPENSSECL